MYDLHKRIQLSAIIPIILVLVYIYRVFQLFQLAVKPTSAQLATSVLVFTLEILVVYFLTLFFFSLETLIRAYITDPQSPESTTFKNEIANTSIGNKIKILFKWDTVSQSNKITRSVIFQVALIVFTIYAITSSGTLTGKGIGLGILLQMLVDQITSLRQNRDISSWFWQIKTNVPTDIQKIYVGAVGVIFVIFLTFILR